MNHSELNHQPAQSLHRVVSLLTFLLILYAVLFSWQSWRKEKADKIRELENLMELEEQAIDVYFTHVQNGMRVLSDDLLELADKGDLDQAFSVVKRFKELHPEFMNITFVREDGQIMFTARNAPGPNFPTLAKEPSFLKYREELQEGRPLDIGQPLVSLINKEWIIPLRYQVRSREGKLAYILSANLPVELLQRFWKHAPFTKDAALGLMRDDGFLISRYPVPTRLSMDEIYGRPRTGALIKHLRQQRFPLRGYVEGSSSLDGPDFLNAFFRLEHYPITLFIAMPVAEVRAGWWDKVRVPYILSALLLIGGLIVYRLTLGRQRARELEQWQTSNALRESEEKYRRIFENELVGICIVDMENLRFIDVNDAHVQLYGYSREEMLSDIVVLDLTAEHDASVASIEQIKSGGSIVVPLRYHKKKDGTVFPVEIFAGRYSLTGRQVAVIMVRDVTARQQMEQALRDSEERFRSIFDNTLDGILFASPEGPIFAANPAACDILGWSEQELYETGRSLEVEANDPRLPGALEERCCTGRFRGELTYKRKDGSTFPVEVSSSLFTLQNGERRAGILFRDITERKKAEQAVRTERQRLNEAMTKLRQSNQALQDFASIASHDMQEPLRKVQSFGNLLKQKHSDTLGACGKDYLDRMLSATDRMQSLLKSLLEYSRVSSRADFFLQVELSAIIRNVLADLEVRIQSTGGEVQVGDLPAIEADPTQMHQLFQNLIGNALKFHKEGEKPVVKVHCRTDNHGSYEISIEDNGIGFEEQYLERIFAPFYRLHGRSSIYEGAGMGLAICRKIVERHSGMIRVESEPGKGSNFIISLPLKQSKLETWTTEAGSRHRIDG